MGKPFKEELKELESTIRWANHQDIDSEFSEIVNNDDPVYCIGSGGSYTSAHYAASLLNQNGIFSKAITPFELFYNKHTIKNSRLLFMSAGGRNKDILSAYKFSIKYDPTKTYTMCMSKGTLLSDLANKYTINRSLEFEPPTGKDGFLATNSLLASLVILNKYFSKDVRSKTLMNNYSFIKNIEKFSKEISGVNNFIVLYGGWAQSVAIDLESKFSEAALGSVMLSDFRNFGHGRHNWLSKHKHTTSIIILSSVRESGIVDKTLKYLNDVPILILKSKYSDSFATIDLLFKSFHLVGKIGEIKKIDPGNPRIALFGRKLYNLNYASLMKDDISNAIDFKAEIAISRKFQRNISVDQNDSEIEFWFHRYKDFIEKINKAKFGAIVFDYDGTLCNQRDRFLGIHNQISQQIIRIVEQGFIIGIATGRGKSVKHDLRTKIPEKYWGSIIIGYYNGAITLDLADDTLLGRNSLDKQKLMELQQILMNCLVNVPDSIVELKSSQISVQIPNSRNKNILKNYLINSVMKAKYQNITVLESEHSIDVIVTSECSKNNVVKLCKTICMEKKLSDKILCIGDKGLFPGNDFELLSNEYSLSVDEVSSDPFTCWNLASPGTRNSDACLEYIKNIKLYSTYFKMSI